MAKTDVPFIIHVVGESTKQTFTGRFSAKTRLSHRDNMHKDRIRRELIGGDPKYASERVLETALLFSELAVRVADAPNWWRDSDNGLELFDDNVVVKVFEECLRVEREEDERLIADGEEALSELKKLSE